MKKLMQTLIPGFFMFSLFIQHLPLLCEDLKLFKPGVSESPVSMSSDGRYIALYNDHEKKIIISDLESKYHFKSINCKEFGRFIFYQFTRNPAELLLIFSANNIYCVKKMNIINDAIEDIFIINSAGHISYDRFSNTLCVTDGKYRLSIFDAANGNLLRYYGENHQFHAHHATVIDSGKYLLLINEQWEYLIDFQTEEIVKKHYISSVSDDYMVSVSTDLKYVVRWSNLNSTFYINDFNDVFFSSKSIKMATTVSGLTFINGTDFIVAINNGIHLMSIDNEVITRKIITVPVSYFDFTFIAEKGLFLISGNNIDAFDTNLTNLYSIPLGFVIKAQFSFDNKNLMTQEGEFYKYNIGTGIQSKIVNYNFDQIPGSDKNYYYADSIIYICDNETGDTLEVHKLPIKNKGINFSPDAKYCQSYGMPVQIWDWKSKELIYRNNNACCYDFSAHSNYIIGIEGTTEEYVSYVRKLPSGEIVFDFTDIKLKHYATNDEEEFLYISDDTHLNKFEISTGELVWTYKFDSLADQSLWHISKGGKYLFLGYNNGIVKMIKMETGEILSEFNIWNDRPTEIILSGDEKYLAVIYYDGSLAVWELPDIVSVSPAEKGPAGLATAEIFPNPSSGEFTIAAGEGFVGEASISVCDLTGREIFRGKVLMYKSQAPLNLTEIAPGPYLLKIHGSQGIAAMPLMIIK